MKALSDGILAVQDFFKLGGSVSELREKYGVNGKTDGELLILDYSMIDADWNSLYPWVCRGLILDANTYDVVAFGLPKFWNASEPAAAKIDWDSSVVFEKLDGTMVQRFWHPYQKRWAYSTRYQLPGELEQNKLPGLSSKTWKQLIDLTVGTVADSICQKTDETSVWEAMSPENIVVVQHTYFKASLICVRNNRSFEEKDLRNDPLAPRTYALSSEEEVNQLVSSLNGMLNEGVVVCDKYFNRVKIKGQDYILKHKTLDGAMRSVGSVLELLHTRDWEEFVCYFPQTKDFITAACNEVDNIIAELAAMYDQIKHIEGQKEFALAVKEFAHPSKNHLFEVRRKSVSVREYAYSLPVNDFVKLFKDRVKLRLKK
jgi:hypothetical protein